MNGFEGRRMIVVGLGASGFAAARVLAGLGARVRVTEGASNPAVEQRAAALREAGAEVETGGHDLDALDADIAVLSPGIPPHAPVVRALESSGAEVISEIELAYRLASEPRAESRDFIAVTGTNGKTTTTSLLAAMLNESGRSSVAAGNIGRPLVEAVFEVPSGAAIAVEVSSFQLATIREFRPRIAVLLNVAEDHTDWHGTFAAYLEAKARIIENQTADDVFLPNADDPAAMKVASGARSRVVPFSGSALPDDGVGVEGGRIVWRGIEIVATDDVPLPGVAGLEDVAAAVGAALEYGAEPSAVTRAIKGFRPLAHRMEVVAEIAGVTYIDDSKATNPHATLAAVRGLRDVVLIAGGRSKGIDLSVLAGTVPPVRRVITLGEAADDIARAFSGLVDVDRAESMLDAVRAARAEAIAGGSVLLSPGCASLDMYESYVQRGEAFVSAVRELLRD